MARHSTVFERQRPSEALVDHALSGVRDDCFWLDDVTRVEYPRLPADTRADLVVVGGGYCGLWTALLAKQRDPGRRVVLLEGHCVGWAASGRNGGFCEASITHGEENGRSRWPTEYPTLEEMGRANLASIAETVERFGMEVEYEATGELAVAVEPHQVDELRASGAELLEGPALRRLVNSPTYLAGVLDPDCALVHPAKLALELARVATELGVEIFEHSPVLDLGADARTGPVSVHTAAGVVRAERVALATNVFPALLKRYRPFTVPVWDFALMTEPLSAEQRAAIGWSDRFGIGDLANQFHYYRQTRDHRILFGGYDAIHHPGRQLHRRHEQRPATFRLLAAHLLTTFPQLEGIRFTHQWGGAIDTSTRFAAFYGTGFGGRVAHAAGFTGLGVGATRFAGNVLLDLLAGEKTERTALEMVRKLPLPFPPEPFASIGIELTRRSLDSADHRQGHRNLWLRTLDHFGLGFDS